MFVRAPSAHTHTDDYPNHIQKPELSARDNNRKFTIEIIKILSFYFFENLRKLDKEKKPIFFLLFGEFLFNLKVSSTFYKMIATFSKLQSIYCIMLPTNLHHKTQNLIDDYCKTKQICTRINCLSKCLFSPTHTGHTHTHTYIYSHTHMLEYPLIVTS